MVRGKITGKYNCIYIYIIFIIFPQSSSRSNKIIIDLEQDILILKFIVFILTH